MPDYRKPYRPPLPRRSRTLPIHGTGEDEGRYFHCWNCGFVCDSQRDKLGDSDSWGGDDHSEYYRTHLPDTGIDSVGKDASKHACLGGSIGHYHVAMRLGVDGDPATYFRRNFISDVSRGCPFCGSTNWRGDY